MAPNPFIYIMSVGAKHFLNKFLTIIYLGSDGEEIFPPDN